MILLHTRKRCLDTEIKAPIKKLNYIQAQRFDQFNPNDVLIVSDEELTGANISLGCNTFSESLISVTSTFFVLSFVLHPDSIQVLDVHTYVNLF